MGSIFRTADALGVEHLYLTGLTGAPNNELNHTRIHKTALGAEETVPWTKAENLPDSIKQLRADGFTIIALEQTPTAISLLDLRTHNHNLAPNIAIIVGHELYGVNEGALTDVDVTIHIPMLGKKESLNVSVAFGIAAAWFRFGIGHG